jgi:hypothetical protein
MKITNPTVFYKGWYCCYISPVCYNTVQTHLSDMYYHYIIGRYTYSASDDIFQDWGTCPTPADLASTAVSYKCWHNWQCFTSLSSMFHTPRSDLGHRSKHVFRISSFIPRIRHMPNFGLKWPIATVLYKGWHPRWTFISLALTAQIPHLWYTLSSATNEYISSGSVCTFPYWGMCPILGALVKMANATVLYNCWHFGWLFVSLSPMAQTCASDTHDHQWQVGEFLPYLFIYSHTEANP